MSEQFPRHLVLVRHGESEGDVRREAYRRGEVFEMTKTVDEEEITPRGEEQSRLSGEYIREHILERYDEGDLGVFFTSPTYRTKQSAAAMALGEIWQTDYDLNERDRGDIKGWTRQKHATEHPESFACMKSDPLNWCPPGGESIIDVAKRAKRFIDHIDDQFLAVVVGHRDWIWAAQRDIEQLSKEEMARVDTDAINNAQIIYYTNVSPDGGTVDARYIWKQSTCPWQGYDETSRIEHAAWGTYREA